MTRGIVSLLALCLLPGCNVDTGDLVVSVVTSWDGEQDPFETAKQVRVRVDGPGMRAGPEDFDLDDGGGTLAAVPIGDKRRITVEGLGFEGKKPVSRGRTGPLTIHEGDNSVALYVGRLEEEGAFSYIPYRWLRSPRAFHTATRLDDGTVLVCGGITRPWRPESGDPLPPPSETMERLDGNSLQIREASPQSCAAGAARCMVSPRVGHSATLLASGNVLVAGGSDGTSPVETITVYSPEDSRFVPTGKLSTPRVWHRAVATDAGALLVGGEAQSGLLVGGELFSGGAVEPKPGLQQGRRGFTLTALPDGTLVAAGGIDAGGQVLDSVELLAPGSPTWKVAPVRMTVPRAYHTATLEPDGTILFIGGLRDLGVGPDIDSNASIERLDPARSSTKELATLRSSRWSHTATLLDDGRVLVVGGFSGNRSGAPSLFVEQITFFESGLVQVRHLPFLREPRAGHTATLLSSGMLLVVGGISIRQDNEPVVSRTAVVFVY